MLTEKEEVEEKILPNLTKYCYTRLVNPILTLNVQFTAIFKRYELYTVPTAQYEMVRNVRRSEMAIKLF